MSQYDDLTKLKKLYDDKVLTKEEYEAQKEKILSRPADAPAAAGAPAAMPGDAPSGGYLALGLFLPLIGLILYLVWMNTFPQRAKSAGKGALIGAGISLVLGLLLPFMFAGLFVNAFRMY